VDSIKSRYNTHAYTTNTWSARSNNAVMFRDDAAAASHAKRKQQRTNFRAGSGYSRSKPGCPSVHLIATFL